MGFFSDVFSLKMHTAGFAVSVAKRSEASGAISPRALSGSQRVGDTLLRTIIDN